MLIVITLVTAGREERDSAIDRDNRAHHLDPPKTLLAHFRRYLKYKCSMMRNTMDRPTPQPRRKNADMN